MQHSLFLSALLLAVLLAALAVLYRRQQLSGRGTLLLAILAGLIFAGWLGYRYVILPEARLQAEIDATQQQLARLPGYRILQQQEPALWHQLNAELSAQLRAGVSPPLAIGHLRAMLTDLLNQRIGRADDNAINRYITVSLKQIESLRARDIQLCFRFLFPQVNGGVNLNRVLPENLIQQDREAIEQLLQQSTGADRKVDVPAAHQDLNRIVQQLYASWGNDLHWLNAPSDAHVNRQKMCDMTIDLYRAILALPPTQAANVLRMMLSANVG